MTRLRAMKPLWAVLVVLLLVMFTVNTPKADADTSSTVDFNNTSDLTTKLNSDGSPEFTNISNGGINNTGSVNVPLGSNDIWTTKQGYSVTGAVGDKYTFSAYFRIAQNSGYGNLGFTAADTNTPISPYGQPSQGLGANYHGGGGGFFNNGIQTSLSWPPDLVLGNWYWMKFEVTAKGSNKFDLKLQIWNTDSTGTLGTMKTEKTQTDVTNTTLGQATTIHAFFGAAGSRMDRIDDFKVDLGGGATFVEAGMPVVVGGTLGSPNDTSISYGGNVTDDRGSAVTQRGVCWSTSSNPTTANSCTHDGTGTGTFTSNVTGLSAGTTYHIRAYATNSVGTSYGNEQTFTTTGVASSADSDAIDNSIEASAPNSGDANNDGTADSDQANVASYVNPITGKYTTLQAPSGCSITSVSSATESVKDAAYKYPAGLMNFTTNCGTPGTTATIKQYYYGLADESYSLRKFKTSTNGYLTIADASIAKTTIGGQTVTVVTYQVTDGSSLDDDAVANGIIVDPAGLAVQSVGAPNTGLR